MKLATIRNSHPDGRLAVVSADGARYLLAGDGVPTLQYALENWSLAVAELTPLARRLADGAGEIMAAAVAAPLPRAWQWLDGSAFTSHGELMQIAFNLLPPPPGPPLMYQGLSDRFYGPIDDIPMTDEELGIDFEGEFGVIVDHVPMGTPAAAALDHVRLVVQINDWSLRTLAPLEMKTGFGWVQAKPACSMAPLALTPDELGGDWRDGRVCLELAVEWNGRPFGRAKGDTMAVGFHDLIAHAARTRHLPAGTIIGSGTVSNPEYRTVGSSCIAERRAIELVDSGAPVTPFMRFGDRVRMHARNAAGDVLFGGIDQQVVAYVPPACA